MKKNSKKTILYIEDDPESIILLKLILEKNDFNLIEADNGIKGIEILNNCKIDLILIDINMPDMNGFETATKIKSMEKFYQIPLIAITGSIKDQTKNIALIAGCDGFLNKPVDPKNITNKLNEFLNGKRETVNPDKIIKSMREYNIQLVSHLENEIKKLNIANEDLKELDTLKSNFISIASHELRTPLVSILGFVDLLIQKRFGSITDKENEILNIINKEAKKLEKIVKDMITVSLLENDSLKLLYEKKININSLIENIVKDLQPIIIERKLSINFTNNDKIPLIECDSTKIIQVVQNIINNSIKKTEDEGEIKIYINYPSRGYKKLNISKTEKYIDIVVEDNGIHVPEERINMIFKKFYNPIEINKHFTSEKDYLGSGIGLDLSISYGIVKNHGGTIFAENIKKNGMRMTIILPISQKQELKSQKHDCL